jgi:hypothetical protein
MFIAPSHPGRPAPLGAACKLNTKTHGAPPERWANLECEAINILLLGVTVPLMPKRRDRSRRSATKPCLMR